MEASAPPKEAATTEQILDEIQKKLLKEQSSREEKIKDLIKKIQDEIQQSDAKGQVILKQKLGNVLTDMENMDTAPSNDTWKTRFLRAMKKGSSKDRLDVPPTYKVIWDLDSIAGESKYFRERERWSPWNKTVELVGREKEKEDIIDQLMLLSRSGNGASPVPVIITIVGLAGIGKTILARHVSEDEKVKKQVGLPAWFIGTNYSTFDADSIADKVIWSVATATTPPQTKENLNIIKIIWSLVTATTPSRTTENLNIIVILDDWNVEIEDKDVKALQEKLEEDWRVKIEGIDLKALQKKLKEDRGVEIGDKDVKALLDKLKEARPRVTAIMITTRSCLVAMARNVAASPVKSYALPGLDENESASLYEKISRLGARDYWTNAKIAGQCRGVPRVLLTMPRHWFHWSSQLTKFMEELIDSYYDEGLPHSCFAYCSLFPQDYLFDAEKLIHLWMAEGFLKPSNIPSTSSGSGSEQDPEEIGRGFLRDLVRRSIFQDVKEDEFGQVRSCRMHPLMHDIARFVADRENITVDPKGHKVHHQVLRASFDMKLHFSRRIPATLFDKAKELRSILFFANTQSSLHAAMNKPVLENIFKTFKRLCVLDLRDLGIVKVPCSIGELKHLEYLDLSQNDMEKLPSSMAKLSNLETLKLSRCYSLKELPKDFECLEKLKHLDMEGCMGLTCMPREMSKLSSLRTLSAFVASKNDPKGGLEELAKLNQLRGYLEILYLDRVGVYRGSGETKYLKEKQHLQRLKLKWDLGDEDSFAHKSVLDRLEPHSDLGVLFLVGYRGQMLSSWLTSIQFKCLVKLSLQNCPGCEYLSEQDQLPKLKILELIRLENLRYIVKNCDKLADFYKTLEELTITDCPRLMSWWQRWEEENGMPFFASISKLHVHHCPKLRRMPLYPRLDMVLEGSTSFGKELVLEGCSLNLLLDTPSTESSSVNYSIPLENLHIQNCEDLENLPAAFQHLGSLQRLTIENCAEINLDGESNKWEEGLESLRFLTLREIPNLRSLSFGDSLTTLRELTLENCHGLTSISDSIGKLTSLRRLVISKCNKLKSLPKTMEKLVSLKTLIILDCTLLLPRCQRETGDDWPQISHIEHIQVK